MARGESPLTLIVTPDAEADLFGIWVYNVEQYQDIAYADAYLDFLKAGISELATEHLNGQSLDGYPEFQYVILRKRPRGHGHYLIYEINELERIVTLPHVYHTRMDVRWRLRDEPRASN